MPLDSSRSFDVIVAGLGAMGSSAAWALAERGVNVLGLDRYAPPHARGSSHGRTRLIREAYFEDPLYVPLVRRAYQRWGELESASGRTLLAPVGALMVGPPSGSLVPGALESARRHDIPVEELDAAGVRRRFPGLEPAPSMVGVLERRGGVLFAERSIEAALAQARRLGATLRVDDPVLGWEPDDEGVAVRTPGGRYRARRLVVAVGPWTAPLLPGLALPLQVTRQSLHWFAPERDADRPAWGPDRHPVTLWEYAPGRYFYAAPDFGHGVRCGIHHGGRPAEPDHDDRTPTPGEVERMRMLVRRHLPGAADRVLESTVCFYTTAPDHHFVVDRHPGDPRVLVASPCSGHGFKFASAVGEVLADLATDGRSPFDLAPFRIGRFGSGG